VALEVERFSHQFRDSEPAPPLKHRHSILRILQNAGLDEDQPLNRDNKHSDIELDEYFPMFRASAGETLVTSCALQLHERFSFRILVNELGIALLKIFEVVSL
jgi:hypothetical protein